MSRESTAARALLAHFNSQLAGRIARRVLKEVSPEAKKRMANAIFDLIPKVSSEVFWKKVLAAVEMEGALHVASAAFKAKVQRQVEADADRWILPAIEAAVKDRIVNAVKASVAGHAMKTYTDAIPGRFQAALEREIERVAREKAEALAKDG